LYILKILRGENKMFSIIMPVYNCEQYVALAIESVLNQKCADFELIIIDDGSKDGSLMIIEKYQKQDSRISVYYGKHRGVSHARNLGIQHAINKYLLFIDCDDIWENDLLEKCKEALCENKNLILFGIRSDYYDEKQILVKSVSSFKGSYKIETIKLEYFYNNIFRKYNMASPCNKVYDKDIISKHKIQFNEACSCLEDLIFNLLYLEYVTEVLVLHKDLYHYRLLILENQVLKRKFITPFENASYVYQSVKRFEQVKKVPLEEMKILYGIVYTQFVNEYKYFSSKIYKGKSKELLKILDNNTDYQQLIKLLCGKSIWLQRFAMKFHLYKLQQLLLWRKR